MSEFFAGLVVSCACVFFIIMPLACFWWVKDLEVKVDLILDRLNIEIVEPSKENKYIIIEKEKGK